MSWDMLLSRAQADNEASTPAEELAVDPPRSVTEEVISKPDSKVDQAEKRHLRKKAIDRAEKPKVMVKDFAKW